MSSVIVKERIYVDDKGKPVPEGHPRAAFLAATPGDEVTEERAAELGVKQAKPAANKAASPEGNKSGLSFFRGKKE